MKVCVYAICKNEEKYVDKWISSMKEADAIYVLDTGSTDKTVESLKKYDFVKVEQEVISPWRFDVARNKSLELVPKDTDICVCTDLDEIFETGWREKLENAWGSDTTRVAYNYNWSLDENGKPLVNFYIEKIHSRNNYVWTHPVHEVLTITSENEKKITIPEITLNHYPDSSKSRSSYLPLLELSVKEDPTDDRNMHYLGREYMYYGKWNDAIDTLIKHLNLEKATWKDERCASMRFISRCYINLNRFEEAKMWLSKAILEAPYLRDPYVEMALLCDKLQDYENVEKYCVKALKITTHTKSYINETFSFDSTIYDLLSLSYFYQNRKEEALLMINKALKINPYDKRLKNNLKIIKESIKAGN